MDLTSINPILLVAAMIAASTPILLAAIGELVVERAGVLNLGVEGMMITGAVCGFIITVNSGSPTMGFVAAAIGGAVLSLLFAFLTQVALANQVASGLALTLFGLGLSALMGQSYVGIKPPRTEATPLGPLADIPVIGPIVFGHDMIIYLGLAIVAATWATLKFTRVGLVLRAVGESHDAAHALGYKVKRIRTFAIMFGGACAGVGGGYLSLIKVPQWTEGMTAGIGWIALALVVFASWKPWRLVLGAYIFGGLDQLQLNLQGASVSVKNLLLGVPSLLMPLMIWLALGLLLMIVFLSIHRKSKPVSRIAYETAVATGTIAILFTTLALLLDDTAILSAIPFIVTIIALVILSADKSRAPGSLGRTFHASG